jgi:hypothetical protein
MEWLPQWGRRSGYRRFRCRLDPDSSGPAGPGSGSGGLYGRLPLEVSPHSVVELPAVAFRIAGKSSGCGSVDGWSGLAIRGPCVLDGWGPGGRSARCRAGFTGAARRWRGERRHFVAISHHDIPPARAGRQDAEVPHQVGARWRHQSGQASHQIERVEDDLGGAFAPAVPEAIDVTRPNRRRMLFQPRCPSGVSWGCGRQTIPPRSRYLGLLNAYFRPRRGRSEACSRP